jgi:hypothetical protein
MSVTEKKENINDWFLKMCPDHFLLGDRYREYYNSNRTAKIVTLKRMREFSKELIEHNCGGDTSFTMSNNLFLDLYAEEAKKVLTQPFIGDAYSEKFRTEEIAAAIEFQKLLNQKSIYYRDLGLN